MFIVFILTEWRLIDLKKSKRNKPKKIFKVLDKIFNYGFLLILMIHNASGVFACSMDRIYSFSSSYLVSNYLTKSNYKNICISAFPDYLALGVLAYNNKSKFYSPQSQLLISFILWDEKRKSIIKIEEAYKNTIDFCRSNKIKIIFLTHKRLPCNCTGTLLLETKKQIRDDESMFVYLLE